MRGSLLALAIFTAAAGTAAAQTSPAPDNAPSAEAPPKETGAALIAKKAIERDGYRNVRGLTKGSDGLWHAEAMRGDTQVQVTVNRSGIVTAQ